MPPTRKRASVKQLLDGIYEENPVRPIPPPPALDHILEYNSEQALIGLYYADYTLRSPVTKPPPKLEVALIEYKDACSDFLDFERFTEAKIDAEAKLLRARIVTTMKNHEENMKLNEQSIPAQSLRYKDYVHLPEEWGSLDQVYWIDAREMVLREEDDYYIWLDGDKGKGKGKGKQKSREKTLQTLILKNACERIGIGYQFVLRILYESVGPGRVPPRGCLKQMVKCGQYNHLKVALIDDYAIARLVTPLAEGDILESLLSFILRARDFWFLESRDIDGRHWEDWDLTPELINNVETPWDYEIRKKYEEGLNEQRKRKGKRVRKIWAVRKTAGLSESRYTPLGSSLMIFGRRPRRLSETQPNKCANGGLGTGFVSNLINSPYASNYRAIYTVRNPATATSLQAVLANAPQSHKYETVALDLSSLETVRKFAAEVNAKVADRTWEPIRALILNGAWQEANKETLEPQTFTKDGFEGHFAINYLANFLFVLLVLQSMDKEHGRIVLVSSWSHDTHDPRNDGVAAYNGEEYKILWRDPEVLSKGVVYKDDAYKAGMRRYGTSKLLLVMFMYELQRRLNSDPDLSKISVLSLDPGAMGGTGLLRDSTVYARFLSTLLYYGQPIAVRLDPNGMFRTPKKSGHDLLLACFDDEYLMEYPKAVYLNGSVRATPSAEAGDAENQEKLWAESLKFAGIGKGDTALDSF
ncbi:WW domain-containing oxidoreductase [Lachnellula suecica]|uniref:WW domain-containing oxidoreductase n=1 Tax=Lachnellula suecica TaxID=602035 RepID=A0A8T9CIA4_9HELO|nr:WW domain-containing oxidoreductase [Lachnellula suecica]